MEEKDILQTKQKPVDWTQYMEIRTTWLFKLILAIQINLIQEQY